VFLPDGGDGARGPHHRDRAALGEHANEQGGAAVPVRRMVFYQERGCVRCWMGLQSSVSRVCQDRERVAFEGELAW